MDCTKIENSVLAIDVSVSFIHANSSQNEHEQALRKNAHEQSRERRQNLSIMRPNCAIYRCTISCLHVPGTQRQLLIHVKNLSEQSNKTNEKIRTKGVSTAYPHPNLGVSNQL